MWQKLKGRGLKIWPWWCQQKWKVVSEAGTIIYLDERFAITLRMIKEVNCFILISCWRRKTGSISNLKNIHGWCHSKSVYRASLRSLQVKEGELFTGFGQFPGALAAGCTVSSDQQADAAEAVGFGHGRLQVPVGAVWIRAAPGPRVRILQLVLRAALTTVSWVPVSQSEETNKQNRATV